MAENKQYSISYLFKADTKRFEQSLGKVEGKLNRFSTNAKRIGATLTRRVALPLAAAGGFAIKFASDLQESMNKADVAFGNSANKVKEFADTALSSFGISEGAALDMMAMFGDMGTSMGLTQAAAADMSTSMTGLAGDLSSFKNIPIQQAMTALAGVFTGETESLKRLGVVMTEVNLKAFALEQGIKKQWKEMTQAEKVNLRYQYILSVTENAQGDFARTSEGAANQMRIFQESLKELAADFGKILLPAFEKGITKVNDLLENFRELSDESKKLIVGISGGTGLSVVLLYLAGTVIPPVLKALKALKNFFIRMNPWVLAAVTAFTAFSSAVSKISDETKVSWWETFTNTIKSLGSPLAFVKNQVKSMADEFERLSKIEIVDLSFIGPLFPGSKRVDMQSILFPGVGSGEDDPFDGVSTRLKALSVNAGIAAQGIIDMSENGLKPAASVLTEFTPKLHFANSLWMEAGQQLLPEFGQALADSFATIADGESPLKRLLTTLKALVVRLLAAAAAAFVLAAALPSFFGGDSSKKGAKFFDAFSKITGMKLDTFASGGIISGPTVGLMGEYPGVRSNPEVVAPLSKLKSLMNNNVSSANGEFILRGQDLVLALQRAERNRTRII